MKSLAVLYVVVSLWFTQATAVTWYYLRYWTPADDISFTNFSMKMVIPSLPQAATYYLWPGLQDVNTTGVFQPVLDGRSGTWWISPGWCCSNPDLAWGSGFNVYEGDVVAIDMVLDAGTANWTVTMSLVGGTASATNEFPLAYKDFNQALFAIELYNVTWDFGQLVFDNISMTMNTTDTSWCTNAPENYDSATNYTLTNVVATVQGASSLCTSDSLVMYGPASS